MGQHGDVNILSQTAKSASSATRPFYLPVSRGRGDQSMVINKEINYFHLDLVNLAASLKKEIIYRQVHIISSLDSGQVTDR